MLCKKSLLIRWFKKFGPGCKYFDDQARSGKSNIMDSVAVLQTTEANPVSCASRVSGEPGILQSSVVRLLYNLDKGIRNFGIVPHATKILQKFWLNLIIHEMLYELVRFPL